MQWGAVLFGGKEVLSEFYKPELSWIILSVICLLNNSSTSCSKEERRRNKLFKLCNIKQSAVMVVVSIMKVLMLLWRGTHTNQLTCHNQQRLRHPPKAGRVWSCTAAHWAFVLEWMCFSNFVTWKKKNLFTRCENGWFRLLYVCCVLFQQPHQTKRANT